MWAFGIVIGYMMTDFELGFFQAGKAVAVKQLRFEAAPKGFDVGIVVAVATPAAALQGPMLRHQVIKSRQPCTGSLGPNG